MADIFGKKERSRIMSRIRGTNTTPEINIRRALYARGFRYRLHSKTLPGRPDLVFKKLNAVIFIHGCFWHNHDCAYGKLPATHKKFWTEKLTRNAQRDKEHIAQLRHAGWRVKVIWGCMLKNRKEIASRRMLNRLIAWLSAGTKTVKI